MLHPQAPLSVSKKWWEYWAWGCWPRIQDTCTYHAIPVNTPRRNVIPNYIMQRKLWNGASDCNNYSSYLSQWVVEFLYHAQVACPAPGQWGTAIEFDDHYQSVWTLTAWIAWFCSALVLPSPPTTSISCLNIEYRIVLQVLVLNKFTQSLHR